MIWLLFFLFAVAQSAVLPIDSSSVNVKHSGQDYSYSIRENHGFAIEPLPQHEVPVIRIAPEQGVKIEHLPMQEELKPMQPFHGMGYQGFKGAVAVVPTYSYLPALPYGLNYPYNLIATV